MKTSTKIISLIQVSPRSFKMKNENEFQESHSELTVSEVLSSRELQRMRHERRQSNLRKNNKTKDTYRSWDLSGGLLGI
jgi:hypothetical protein